MTYSGKHTLVKRHHRKPAMPVRAIAATAGAASMTASAGIMIVAASSGHATPATLDAYYTAPGQSLTVAAAEAPQESSNVITIRSGDTLSEISSSICHTPADWTGIWNYNHRRLHWTDPNVIEPGQQIIPDCRQEQVWLPQPPPAPVVTTSVVHYGDTATVRRSADVSTAGMGGFQSCVIRAESGGNPDIWNASGHWGLYQFSEQTWVAHGGAPGDFGTASPAEQTQIFWNTVGEDGTSDWAPYDGC